MFQNISNVVLIQPLLEPRLEATHICAVINTEIHSPYQVALGFWAGVEDGWVGVGHFKGKVFDDIVKAGQTNTEWPISRKPRDRENETTQLNKYLIKKFSRRRAK